MSVERLAPAPNDFNAADMETDPSVAKAVTWLGDTKASVVQHLPAWLLSDLLREDGILIVAETPYVLSAANSPSEYADLLSFARQFGDMIMISPTENTSGAFSCARGLDTLGATFSLVTVVRCHQVGTHEQGKIAWSQKLCEAVTKALDALAKGKCRSVLYLALGCWTHTVADLVRRRGGRALLIEDPSADTRIEHDAFGIIEEPCWINALDTMPLLKELYDVVAAIAWVGTDAAECMMSLPCAVALSLLRNPIVIVADSARVLPDSPEQHEQDAFFSFALKFGHLMTFSPANDEANETHIQTSRRSVAGRCWLESCRLDPDVRGQRFLLDQFLEWLQRHGYDTRATVYVGFHQVTRELWQSVKADSGHTLLVGDDPSFDNIAVDAVVGTDRWEAITSALTGVRNAYTISRCLSEQLGNRVGENFRSLPWCLIDRLCVHQLMAGRRTLIIADFGPFDVVSLMPRLEEFALHFGMLAVPASIQGESAAPKLRCINAQGADVGMNSLGCALQPGAELEHLLRHHQDGLGRDASVVYLANNNWNKVLASGVGEHNGVNILVTADGMSRDINHQADLVVRISDLRCALDILCEWVKAVANVAGETERSPEVGECHGMEASPLA
jgi:hypothetical protein